MISKFKLDISKQNEKKEAVNRSLEIVDKYAGNVEIQVIPLDRIELDPDNNRDLILTLEDAINGIKSDDPEYEKKTLDWKSLESLATTIKNDQLINPIVAYRFGNKCRLIAGERRTLASAIAGKKEIIARVIERPAGLKLRILQWTENNERVDLSLAERLASIEAIIKAYFDENKEANSGRVPLKILSELTGMSMTQSRRYFLLLQAKPEIKQAVIEGRLDNIKLVELICSVKDTDTQTELLNAALAGTSFESIENLKKELEAEEVKKNREAKLNKKGRGRPQVGITIGKVKPNVAKIILEALVKVEALKGNVISELQKINDKIQWEDENSIRKSLRRVFMLLGGE